MLIRSLRDCTCFHHRLLECIEKGVNDEAKAILKNTENLSNLADNSRTTLLHYSAKYGNTEMVQNLIDKDCKINVQDISGVTPLILAVQNKHVTTVDVSLKNNGDIFVTDRNQMSGLHLAAYFRLYSSDRNSYLILDEFLNKIKKDLLTNRQRITRLLLKANDLVKLSIVVFGDKHLASFILKNGYMLEYREYKGRTALSCAILYVKIDNTKLLIEHGANINAVNQCNGCMPIQYYYIRNQELLAALESTMESMLHLKPYYYSTVQTKMEHSRNKVELDRKAALAFETLTGLSSVAYHNIVFNILSHLDSRDLQNLCESIP